MYKFQIMLKNHKIITIAAVAIVIIIGGALSLGSREGTCTLYCTSKAYKTRSTHGPYDYYSKTECEEKIETTQTILTDCTWEWEVY